MLIDYRALRNQIPMERVLDLIGYHPTSRRGHRLRGACPFHAPEHPIPRCFSVELTKGSFAASIAAHREINSILWSHGSACRCTRPRWTYAEHAASAFPRINSDSAAQIAGSPWPAKMAPLLAATDKPTRHRSVPAVATALTVARSRHSADPQPSIQRRRS